MNSCFLIEYANLYLNIDVLQAMLCLHVFCVTQYIDFNVFSINNATFFPTLQFLNDIVFISTLATECRRNMYFRTKNSPEKNS